MKPPYVTLVALRPAASVENLTILAQYEVNQYTGEDKQDKLIICIPLQVDVPLWRTAWILAIQFMSLFSTALKSFEDQLLKPEIIAARAFVAKNP